MKPTRTLLLTALAATLTLAVTPGASADDAPTTVGIASALRSGATISVEGTLALGPEASASVTIADDPAADALTPGLGQDVTKVTVTPNLASKRLTYTMTVPDQISPEAPMAPGTGFVAPFTVDGENANLYLATGFAGSSFPPAAGKWWALCNVTNGSYACPVALTGTMGNDSITLQLPFTRAAIQPGSIIEAGSGANACIGLCSLPWAVVMQYSWNDSAEVSGFYVPGGVRLGIATATTPTESVVTEDVAEVAEDVWSGTLAAPTKAGAYKIVARSCSGLAETPTCATATIPFTV